MSCSPVLPERVDAEWPRGRFPRRGYWRGPVRHPIILVTNSPWIVHRCVVVHIFDVIHDFSGRSGMACRIISVGAGSPPAPGEEAR